MQAESESAPEGVKAGGETSAPDAARERPDDAREPPPGNDTFLLLGKYNSGTALDRLLDEEHDERASVLGIADAHGILPDSVNVWFATGDYDIIVWLGNATPRIALAFAIAFARDGVETKTLSLYDDLKRVSLDAARARTQRGESGSTRGSGEDGMG